MPGNLPPSAEPAWRAYREMLASKDAHYGFLESLEIKYQQGGQMTLAERAKLDTLLSQHDLCVQAFASAIKELSAAAPAVRDELLRLLTMLGSDAPSNSH